MYKEVLKLIKNAEVLPKDTWAYGSGQTPDIIKMTANARNNGIQPYFYNSGKEGALNDIMDQDNLYRVLNKMDYRQKTVPTRSTLQFSNPYLPIDGYSNTIPNNIG